MGNKTKLTTAEQRKEQPQATRVVPTQCGSSIHDNISVSDAGAASDGAVGVEQPAG